MKRIAILGSTGSVGTQALDVIERHGEAFAAEVLTANRNLPLLVEQARRLLPNAVVIADESLYIPLKEALNALPIKVFAGMEALCQVAAMSSVDLVLNALVGISGLQPTLAAMRAGKTIALANKESLVVAGELIGELSKKHGGAIIPVDSEHSAIFQCLTGEQADIEKVILTASGGPFLHASIEEMAHATPSAALRHPQWKMGSKITIDSATMMNKGFEEIEARWLFSLAPSQIEVVVHEQSVVHSMVQFVDGSIKAQLGMPDMRIPIAYALAYPQRLPLPTLRYDFVSGGMLTFLPADENKFPCLRLARAAMLAGGGACCALNAANEIAVQAFLEERILYPDIARVVAHCMAKYNNTILPCSLEDYLAIDTQVRSMAQQVAVRR